MKSKRADKVLLSAMPTPPANDRDGNGSSPYRAPGDTRPRIAPERAPRWRPKENILEVAAATGRFETLRQALDAAGLAATLAQSGPFTLFAPTDKAFAQMPSADLRALLADKA